MPTIEDIFEPHTATASSFSTYEAGDVAYVTNGFKDNGVLGFVAAKPDDRVYEFNGIVLSAFCEATLQIAPYIARGNGGSGLIVLEPKVPLSTATLGYLAAHINTALKWRFNWYRQATTDRIRRLAIPDPIEANVSFPVKEFLPVVSQTKQKKNWEVKFRPFALDELFELASGDYHNAAELPDGDVPLISCGDADNGITRFVSVPPENIYNRKLTIAFNGMNTLTTKYHPYDFATKDDVAICTARSPLKVSTLMFIQLMMAREKWRYSYYRKCFMEKLSRQSVLLPAKKSEVDEETIEIILKSTAYWDGLRSRLE
ncbi:hypothetical protein [Bradyrhizobium sp. CW10]|uniref:hypothetical protein n=1 Tax=Bradyrhizobium sp. CW10 TaxID=2782683 RepID=UPI001FF71516|nr:hypothetical protein [Bradyrhizobium sp. CW10]MCK1469941.1 hypothetical protein [Bradyrhizobium sp. CW10]